MVPIPIDFWPIAVIVLGCIAAYCFLSWIAWRREMEREHHRFQDRGFVLEEKKFEVWKTMNYAHVSGQSKDAKKVVDQAMRGQSPQMLPMPGMTIEPDPGKVVSMFGGRGPHRERGPHAPSVSGGMATMRTEDGEPPTEEDLQRIGELLVQARSMPEAEARAFLKEHGIEGAVFFGSDDPPDGPAGPGPTIIGRS